MTHHPRPRRTRLDAMLDAGAEQMRSFAELVPVALAHIDRELRVLDGYAASTTGRSDPTPGGTSELTSVERVADARWRLSATRSQILDDRDAILSLIHSAMQVCRDAIGTRVPVVVPRCSDVHLGRDGSAVWAIPACEDAPAKAGLCSACYQRERRWRIGQGLPERDFVPAR